MKIPYYKRRALIKALLMFIVVFAACFILYMATYVILREVIPYPLFNALLSASSTGFGCGIVNAYFTYKDY